MHTGGVLHFMLLSESWKQVLISETFSASNRAGTSRCQVLFEISALMCCLYLCSLLQSWQQARALCSAQRREPGVPLSHEDQIILLACMRLISFYSTVLERGWSSPKGQCPLLSPSATQGMEAGSWGFSGCFYAGQQLEKDFWSFWWNSGCQIPIEGLLEVPAHKCLYLGIIHQWPLKH